MGTMRLVQLKSNKCELLNVGVSYLKRLKFKEFFAGIAYLALSHSMQLLDHFKYNIVVLTSKNRFIRVKIHDNSLVHVDLQDRGLSKELLLYGKREVFSTSFLMKFLDKDDVIIDIGANLGYYVILECKIANKGWVYAIEPVPQLVNLLKENVKLNNCKNVSIFQLAIGESNTSKKMYIYDRLNWSSLFRKNKGKVIKVIEVPMLTLDTFVERYVNKIPTFIRMDVEGYEYNILKHSQNVLKKYCSKMFIELHPHLLRHEELSEIIEIFKRYGFKIKAIFLEPPMHVYRALGIVNKLRKVIGVPEFGFVGDTYNDLQRILSLNYTARIFLERV